MTTAARWNAKPIVGMTVQEVARSTYNQLRDLQQALQGQDFTATFAGLSDVTITNAQQHDTLRWSGSSWVNSGFLKNTQSAVIVGTDPAKTTSALRVGDGIEIPNDKYFWASTNAGTATRLIGMAASDVVYVGSIDAGGPLQFRTGGTDRWQIDASGHLSANADNQYDIGISPNFRPRSGYFGTSLVVGADPGTAGGGILRVGGGLKSVLGTITTDQQGLWSTATWNNSGVTFVHNYIDITATVPGTGAATNYAFGSRLVDVRHNNVSRFVIALGGQFPSNLPLVQITPPANFPGLGVYTSHTGIYGESVIYLQPSLNTSGSPSLFYLNAVNAGGYGALTQLLRAGLDGGTLFSVLIDGTTGLAGGASTDAVCRIGVGHTNTLAEEGLQVNTALNALGLDHWVVNILGAGQQGTYTTPVVYSLKVGTYSKWTNQTIGTWYGIKVDAGPTATTKWSGHFAEDVNIGGDLYVGGSLIGGGGVTTLNDLTDVTITTPATGHFLRYNGSLWVNQLGVAEADVVDGALLARVADNEVVTGAWQFQSGVTVGDDLVAGSFVSVVGAGVGGSLYGIRTGDEANPDGKWAIFGDTANNDMQFATNEVTRGKIINTTGVLQWAYQIESTVTTGTAPFIIASTTLVTNLNADLLDGLQGAAYAALADDETVTGSWTFPRLTVTGGTVTSSTPLLDATQTWNAAVTFDALKVNITDTSSNDDSRFLLFQRGGSTRLLVGLHGEIYLYPTSVGGYEPLPLYVANHTTTGGTPLMQLQQTWNSGATTMPGIVVQITNTASAAASRILDLQVATSVAAWDVSGYFYVQGTKVVGTRVTGYTAFSGTVDRGTSYATSTITLAQLAERVNAIQTDLTAHGLIGA